MRPDDMLTVVVPAFNEEATLPLLHARLRTVLDGLDLQTCVLYVDDGSRDATWDAMRRIAQDDPHVALLRLSRNFGKEAALTAGLDHVTEGAALILDSDGQDPPELIPEFVARWREGHDDVFGTRLDREGESWLKRASAHGFYRVIGLLSKTPIPRDTGDFRLLSRRALDGLAQMRERGRFMKGMFAWVGFRQAAVPYHRAPRMAGRSKFSYWKLWNFALDGITSFSTSPLRVATYFGLLTAVAAFGFGGWTILKTLLWGDAVHGYPTLITVVLFLGGIQLIALGVIGEYLGRLYQETKQRPLYLLDAWLPATDEAGNHLQGRTEKSSTTAL
ncbi:MAG: glycosyltransferase family 2 protein [Lysobacteraceae bacterium]